MKSISRLLVAGLIVAAGAFAGCASGGHAKAGDCCAKAKAAGKACDSPCCVEAAKTNSVCKKCNPA